MWRALMVLAGVSLITACSFVKLSPEGDRVRVLTVDEVAKCERVGQTTVSLMAKVGVLKRHPDQVQAELDTLARNSAAKDLGGDTVAPISPVVDGKQTYGVYRCMPR